MSYSHPRPARPIALYDGQCMLCTRAMRSIQSQDKHRRIAFVDIAHPEFNAAAWGFCQPQLNATLHVRDSQGTWRKGVDAIAYLHRAVGMGWLWWPTRFTPVMKLAERIYPWLAANRYRMFGRVARDCANGHCHIHGRDRVT